MVLVSMIRKGRLATKRQQEKGRAEERGGIEGEGRKTGGRRERRREEREKTQATGQ